MTLSPKDLQLAEDAIVCTARIRADIAAENHVNPQGAVVMALAEGVESYVRMAEAFPGEDLPTLNELWALAMETIFREHGCVAKT